MNSAEHNAAALLLLDAAEKLALHPITSRQLAELAGHHANEAERLALAAVEIAPAPHPEAEPYAHHFPATPGDDAINA